MDIVERLRSHMGKQDISVLLADCRAAADEIERLRSVLLQCSEQSRGDEGLIPEMVEAVLPPDLQELGRERSAAKIALDAVGLRNTAGLSAEERIVLDMEYQRAMSRYQDAEMKYQAKVRWASIGQF